MFSEVHVGSVFLFQKMRSNSYNTAMSLNSGNLKKREYRSFLQNLVLEKIFLMPGMLVKFYIFLVIRDYKLQVKKNCKNECKGIEKKKKKTKNLKKT